MRSVLVVLVAALLLGLTGCGASHRRYTVEQVEQAFAAQGVRLRRVGAEVPPAFVVLRHGTMPHLIFVGVQVVSPRPGHASYFGTDRHGERFTFTKRGNVLVLSDRSDAAAAEAALARLH